MKSSLTKGFSQKEEEYQAKLKALQEMYERCAQEKAELA